MCHFVTNNFLSNPNSRSRPNFSLLFTEPHHIQFPTHSKFWKISRIQNTQKVQTWDKIKKQKLQRQLTPQNHLIKEPNFLVIILSGLPMSQKVLLSFLQQKLHQISLQQATYQQSVPSLSTNCYINNCHLSHHLQKCWQYKKTIQSIVNEYISLSTWHGDSKPQIIKDIQSWWRALII